MWLQSAAASPLADAGAAIVKRFCLPHRSAFWGLFYTMEAGAIMTILSQHGGNQEAAVRGLNALRGPVAAHPPAERFSPPRLADSPCQLAQTALFLPMSLRGVWEPLLF